MTEAIAITWKDEPVGEIVIDCEPDGYAYDVELRISAKEPKRLARLAIFQNAEGVSVPGGTVPLSLEEDAIGIAKALAALSDRVPDFQAATPAAIRDADPAEGLDEEQVL